MINDYFNDAMLRLQSNPYLAKEWPKYVLGPDAEKHESARACVSGVYLLFSADGDLVYVGQSEYVGQRIQQHRASGRKFATFAWVEVPSGLLQAVEAAYIHALRPTQNAFIPDPVYMQHDRIKHAILDRWARSASTTSTEVGRSQVNAEIAEAK